MRENSLKNMFQRYKKVYIQLRRTFKTYVAKWKQKGERNDGRHNEGSGKLGRIRFIKKRSDSYSAVEIDRIKKTYTSKNIEKQKKYIFD